MSAKLLVEVLAHLHVMEKYKRAPDVHPPWENLSDEMRSLELSGMAEVVRSLGLFGWEVFREADGRTGVRPVGKPGLTKAQVAEMKKQNDPTLTQGEISPPVPRPRFTGRACDHCQSLNTVQNGKCLLCMDCNQTGECG